MPPRKNPLVKRTDTGRTGAERRIATERIPGTERRKGTDRRIGLADRRTGTEKRMVISTNQGIQRLYKRPIEPAIRAERRGINKNTPKKK